MKASSDAAGLLAEGEIRSAGAVVSVFIAAGMLPIALLLVAFYTACASAPERIACRDVSVSAPAPAGPFPAYLAPPSKRDVLVFVHGLGGDAIKSWTNRRGVYWPRVVADDPELADYDVYVYAYESDPGGECLGVPDLATQMHTRLVSDRVFEAHDRVIFVSHSLGGLIVRDMLTTFDELIPKTPLLVFYGTPGHGVELARWASMITHCQQVHDLRPEELNSYIRSLNNNWKHRISNRVRSRCAIEGFNRLVKPDSGEALCDDISQTIAGDHSDIVKVDCERDDPHVFLKNVLSEGEPSRLAVKAGGVAVRQITEVGDVGAVAVAADAKTVFITRREGVQVTDIAGTKPWMLFKTFFGTIACGEHACYFSGRTGERDGVYRFTKAEGPVLLLDGNFSDIAVSPKGDRLLLRREEGQTSKTDILIHRITDGSQTVERSSNGWLHDPSWGPDGRSILYVESLKEAILQDLASGKRTPLPTASDNIFEAAWETHGKYVLAYALTSSGTTEFWILRPGSQPTGPLLHEQVRYQQLRTTPLPNTFAAVRAETYSLSRLVSLERPSDERPFGRRNLSGPFSWTSGETLMYAVSDENESWIVEYDIYSQQERRLSPTPFLAGRPMMTPDGTRLVFVGAPDRHQAAGLWSSALDGWNPVSLSRLPTTSHVISKDSRYVAFIAFGPDGGLYAVSTRGSDQPHRLTGGYIYGASFAGSRMLIFRRESEGRRPLCKMDRDGGKESCFALDRVDGFVVSPDGKTVVALTPSVSDSVQTRTPLHFIDIASGAITKVVFVPRWVDVEAGIAWTADGSRIVYATHSSLSTSAVESYRIADGMNDIISKPSEGFVRDITVSPDGRHAVFQRITGSSDAVLLTVSP